MICLDTITDPDCLHEMCCDARRTSRRSRTKEHRACSGAARQEAAPQGHRVNSACSPAGVQRRNVFSKHVHQELRRTLAEASADGRMFFRSATAKAVDSRAER